MQSSKPTSPSHESELLFKRKDLLRQILDNPLFEDLIKSIKAELASAMMSESDAEKRNEIYHTNAALDKLVRHLTKFANDARMELT